MKSRSGVLGPILEVIGNSEKSNMIPVR